MGELDFKQHVEQNKIRLKNQENIEQQQADTRHMTALAGYMNDKKFDRGGFTSGEVYSAAKFILQAQMYEGMDSVKNLDVSDSPVYYKTVGEKKCARGWRERKKLEKTGKRLISLAQKKKKHYAEMDLGKDVFLHEKEWKRAEKDPKAPPTNVEKMMNRFFEKGVVRSADALVKYENEKVKDIKYDEKAKKLTGLNRDNVLQYRIHKTLEGDLRSFQEWKAEFTARMYRLLDEEERKGNVKEIKISKEMIEKLKKGHYDKWKGKMEKIRKLYQDVEKGLVSPEALKVFLAPDIMTLNNEATRSIYTKLQSDRNWVNVNQVEQYREELKKLVDEYEPENIRDQKGVNGKEPLTDTSRGTTQEKKERIKEKLKKVDSFIFFTGKKYAEKDAKASKRVYITCRSDKFAEMAGAWAEAIKKNSEIKEDFSFKLKGMPGTSEVDNIVVYLPDWIDMKKFNKLLDDFKAGCGDDVLADKSEMPMATNYVSPGISKTIEFPFDEYYSAVKECYDGSEYERSRKILNSSNGSPFTFPSYNQHIGQMLYLAVSMVRKNHPELGDKKIEEDEALKKELTHYFSDLLRLSGADPETMNDF